MTKIIRIKRNWLIYAIVIIVIGIMLVNTTLVECEIITTGPEGKPWWNERSYHPYPILFQHGFAGGSNFTWNPDPNAKDQVAEQKKPTAVLNEYFKKYLICGEVKNVEQS